MTIEISFQASPVKRKRWAFVAAQIKQKPLQNKKPSYSSSSVFVSVSSEIHVVESTKPINYSWFSAISVWRDSDTQVIFLESENKKNGQWQVKEK